MMFDSLPDSLGGLPLHPLVVHAVVVGAPLAALLGLLFALPRTRRWARVPLAVVAVLASAAAYVSVESGGALKRSLGIEESTPQVGAVVAEHAMLAHQLEWFLLGYAVLAVLNAVVVTPRRREERAVRAVDRVLPVLLVVGAVLVTVWTVRVGDLGARAVWG